jgi:hypothetical protein
VTGPETIFDIWAPEASPWSPWVKPILFSQMTPNLLAASASAPIGLPSAQLPQLPPAFDNAAIIINCPGVRSVALGLAAAQVGYRPVPLFNALPGPAGAMSISSDNPLDAPQTMIRHSIALVEIWPIVIALINASAPLSQLHLADNAPPVFLLDSKRRSGIGPHEPNRFDNRSVSFATDFPSANFLLANGIQRALLIQEADLQPQSDLAHTLLRWEEGRIRIDSLALDTATAPTPIAIQKPSFFRRLWYRIELMRGLQPVLGGFGGTIPEESSGSGG